MFNLYLSDTKDINLKEVAGFHLMMRTNRSQVTEYRRLKEGDTSRWRDVCDLVLGWEICWHLVSICVHCCIRPHHSHPAQSRDTLADGWKVVEEATAAIPFSEVLDLLDVIRNRLQQIVKLHLHVKRKDRQRCRCERTADGATFYMKGSTGADDCFRQSPPAPCQSSELSTGTSRAQL